MIWPSRPPYAQRGLTLIELMIALGLGLLLVAALGYLYAGQRQSWRTLEAVARLQENGRLAMELIGRALRQAGYAGCLSLPEARPVLQAKLANTTEQSAFSNLIDPFLTGGRLVTGYAGWGVDRNLDGTVNSTDRPNNYLVGTDTLFLVGGQDPVAYTSAAMASVSAAIPITANSLRFSQGELVLISDCRGGDVFRISGAGNDKATFTNPLPHDATRNENDRLTRSYEKGASVMPLALHVYYWVAIQLAVQHSTVCPGYGMDAGVHPRSWSRALRPCGSPTGWTITTMGQSTATTRRRMSPTGHGCAPSASVSCSSVPKTV